MCATLAGTPSLSLRRKSISRYGRLCPPPWCRAVMRPCTFRPPRECSGRTSDFSGSVLVTSAKSEPLAPRRPGVVGFFLRRAMSGRLSSGAEDVDSVPRGEGHDRSLGVRPLAPAVPGAPALALPVHGVDPGHLDPEHGLDRQPDLGLVGLRGDDEGVLALVEQPVALLRDHRPQQDVPRVVVPAHWTAALSFVVRARSTNAVRACSVKTT